MKAIQEIMITDIENRKVFIRNRTYMGRILINIKNLIKPPSIDGQRMSKYWEVNTFSLTKKELEDILEKTEWNE